MLLLTAVLVVSLPIILLHSVAAAPVVVENFAGNTFDQSLWHKVQLGTGPTINVANDRLEIFIPTNSTNDPVRPIFGAALTSNCLLSGDFDMQVAFQLLTWPSMSGVRTGLGNSFLLGGVGSSYSLTPFAVERDSFGLADSQSVPHENYLTHLIDGVQGIVQTGDLSGTLRLVRSGATATGYYLSSGNWVPIHTGSATIQDVGFGFGAWSHNALFANETVKVAFDNFTLTSGRILCPKISLTPTMGAVGTKVTVHGSGFPAPQFLTPSISTVTVSFDDMFLGYTSVQGGSFNFTFDVPDAQAGPHQVKALDALTGTLATSDFQVTSSSVENVSVTLAVGAVYFPGETATMYVLTSLNGMPDSSVNVQLVLHRPDNSVVQINATSIGLGQYKASYTIPKTGSLGTYAVSADAKSQNGSGSALASFEVKQSWTAANAPTIAVVGGSSLAGIGLALVAWRKGYLGKQSKQPF